MHPILNLEKKLSKLKEPLLISFHDIADADAIASGLALKEFLKSKKPDLKCISLNSQARMILEKNKIHIPVVEGIEKYNSIVLVDVSDPEMLGSFKDRIEKFAKSKTLVTIDHHETLKKIKNASNFNYHATSCSEIINGLFKKTGRKPSKKTSLLLLLGIISDTHYFREAGVETFKNAGELLANSEVSYSKAIGMLKECKGKEHSENILDKIKTAFLKNGVAIAKADTNRTEVASILSEIAPIGIAVGNGRITIVQNSACSKLNVGTILKECAARFNGNGWGHENIGGCEIKDVEAALAWIMEKLESERLQSQGSSRATPSR